MPPPIKVRDKFLVTQAADPKELKRLEKAHPGRELLSLPPEMAFGTGDHATTSTCLRILVDIAKSRPAGWSCVDLGCGTGRALVPFARRGFQCVGVDLSPEFLQIVGEKAMAEGDRLAAEIEAAKKLPDAELSAAISAIKQVGTACGTSWC